MSQENVEMIRRAYADPRGMIAASADTVAPDAVFDFSGVYPDQPVLTGLEEVRRFRAEGPWEELHFDPERVIDVDDERVLVLVRAASIGKSSGAPTEAAVAHEFTIRAGLVVRVKFYGVWDEALEAVGLGNSSGTPL